jgi:hypothetical protein
MFALPGWEAVTAQEPPEEMNGHTADPAIAAGREYDR